MIDTLAPAKSWTFENATELGLTIDKIVKINARVAKRGLQGGWTWTITEGSYVKHNEVGFDYTVNTYRLDVFGSMPTLGGWSFLAALEADKEMGFFTRPMPGFTGTIDPATVRPGFCDHCKTDRYRKATYILEDAAGERVQVGSSCIKDFLGHDFSAAWLSSAEDMDDESYGPSGSYGEDRRNVDEVLVLAVVATRIHGWVARSAYTGTPTSSRVNHVFNPPRGNDQYAKEIKAEAANLVASITDADRAQVALVKAWIAQQDEASEYMTNLRKAAAVETIPVAMFGVLVSGPGAYNRAMGKIVERAAKQTSEFVGQTGDKIQAEVEVQHIRYIESDWGTTTLITFVTPEGNLIKWFQSASSNVEFEIGDKATIKATVKKTEIFNDVKATVVLRVKKVA